MQNKKDIFYKCRIYPSYRNKFLQEFSSQCDGAGVSRIVGYKDIKMTGDIMFSDILQDSAGTAGFSIPKYDH